MPWYAIITKSQGSYHKSFVLSSKLYKELVEQAKTHKEIDLLGVKENISNKEINNLMEKVSKLTNNLNRGSNVNLEKELKKLKFTSPQEHLNPVS